MRTAHPTSFVKTLARRRWVMTLMLVAAPVLAACIEVTVEPDPTTTVTPDPTTAATPSATASPSPSPDPVMSMKRFETPSGNILCESFRPSLLCVINSGLAPEPSHEFCPVDWIGLFIQVGEYSGPSCSGDPGIERSPAAELPYGRTWSRAGVTCYSEPSGLTCEDDVGNGFSLARGGWKLLGKQAAARAAFDELWGLVSTRARSYFAERGLDVETIDRPIIIRGDRCGELQMAAVFLTTTDGLTYAYEACFVSGVWHLDGPFFAD